LAIEGLQQLTRPREASHGYVNDNVDSLEDKSKGEGAAPKTLKVQTVQVYLAAIAELYAAQVSIGINKNTNFRGAVLKKLINGLVR
jgi:hypothetical protein